MTYSGCVRLSRRVDVDQMPLLALCTAASLEVMAASMPARYGPMRYHGLHGMYKTLLPSTISQCKCALPSAQWPQSQTRSKRQLSLRGNVCASKHRTASAAVQWTEWRQTCHHPLDLHACVAAPSNNFNLNPHVSAFKTQLVPQNCQWISGGSSVPVTYKERCADVSDV